jgi:hypothetical protein
MDGRDATHIRHLVFSRFIMNLTFQSLMPSREPDFHEYAKPDFHGNASDGLQLFSNS